MSSATSHAAAGADVVDFADRLDPLLVKELRQGLRNRMFVSAFLLAQVFVVVILGLETLTAGVLGSKGHEIWFGLQWAAEILATCVLLPMRCLSAAGEEARASGLDLLRLTNVDAAALVYGKWKTQLLLSGVLLVSLAPYHFLRYYMGGVDVIAQALQLAWCWSESALLSAICLSLSTIRAWARVIWGGVLFVPLWFTVISSAYLLTGQPLDGNVLIAAGVWAVVWFGATMFFLTLAISGFDTLMRSRQHSEH